MVSPFYNLSCINISILVQTSTSTKEHDMTTKQPTIDDLISKFSAEEIQHALLAKQRRELEPRKEAVLKDWEALKSEVAAIREIDSSFPLPWKKTGVKKVGGSVQLVDADLLRIQSLLGSETKPLKVVAEHLKAPWQTVKKFLKVYPAFKLTSKDGKSFLSYSPK
jgi:hypothetical protein